MYRKVFNMLSLFLVVAVAFSVVAPALADSENGEGKRTGQQFKNGVYIVQMADDPVVAYNGGIKGLKATAPKNGQKIDPNSADVVNYVAFLNGKHNGALANVGGANKLYDYNYSFNGFAAQLTAEQAAKMTSTAGVVAVTADEIRYVDTSSTPTFLGLDAANGLWSQLGGTGLAGDGVVVGIVDTGIWPENPSFSDRTGLNGNGTQDGKLDFQQIPGWHGKCTPGEEFTASNCNQKVIGAQWFNAGFGGDAGIDSLYPWEFVSARDADGHGSHTSSTAAGNYGVDVTVDGIYLGKISGMAPHARIATYKVCWGGADGGCFGSDSVAAIDQAVADGVDVINFSISGSTTSFTDPVEIAFLFAAQAGVFVAASAGNSGPGASTVAHNSPWLTTVAAGTHDRLYVATATLGNGVTYTGVGNGAAVSSSPLIASTTAGLAGANPTEVRLCFSGTLDPAIVAGKIVVCDRGVNARTDKSLAVQMAGGVGMILTNTGPNSLNADLHFVPTVHLAVTDRAAVLAYATTPGATASLGQGSQISGAVAPDVASFSSRGPALAGRGDLLKPDIMAPGVDILAAVSPAAGGRDWDFLSGTSMSSPHMAGLGALMKQAHPNWSPMMIKSAFMTTAAQTRNNGSAIPGGNPFGYGAGQVVPNSAVDPGLVYNSGFNDWRNFLKGQGLCNFCFGATPATAVDASNLNLASIAIGDVVGSQTVTRTVTNVSNKVETYSAAVSLVGFNVVVSPSSFTINPGATQTYTVQFTTTTAALNTYTFGSLTWAGNKGHVVKSQIALRPVAMSAPAQVSGSYNVTFGYTGAFTAEARGLVPAATFAGTVQDDPTNTFVVGGPGVVSYDVTVPAGTTYARFSLFDANVAPASDIDLYVYLGAAQVGSSGSGTSNEEVNLSNPAAGTYTVYVHGWQTGGPSADFTLFSWVLGSAAAGNMNVSAPASAVTGVTSPITLTFSDLTAGTKYLGSVAYSGIDGLPNPTIVRIDAP